MGMMWLQYGTCDTCHRSRRQMADGSSCTKSNLNWGCSGTIIDYKKAAKRGLIDLIVGKVIVVTECQLCAVRLEREVESCCVPASLASRESLAGYRVSYNSGSVWDPHYCGGGRVGILVPIGAYFLDEVMDYESLYDWSE